MRNSHRIGDYLAVCDECGFAYFASQMRKRWDGAFVDNGCWEPRHPQDFVKAKKDPYPLKLLRPSVISASASTDIPEFIGETSIRTATNNAAAHLFATVSGAVVIPPTTPSDPGLGDMIVGTDFEVR